MTLVMNLTDISGVRNSTLKVHDQVLEVGYEALRLAFGGDNLFLVLVDSHEFLLNPLVPLVEGDFLILAFLEELVWRHLLS